MNKQKSRMKQLLYLTLFFWGSALMSSFAQEGDFLMENSNPVKDERYQDVKGVPYLFNDFVNGTITDLEGRSYDAMLNYNGHTQQIEVKRGDQFIILDEKFYRQVDMDWNGQTITFMRGVDRLRPNTFMQVLYKGAKVKLIKDFKVDISEQKVQNVGQTVYFKRFTTSTVYQMSQLAKLTRLQLNKKSLSKALGDKTMAYAKAQKINFKDDIELAKLVAYYEQEVLQ